MVEIVSDISGNHGGSLHKARCLITAAALAGCDYAKFQFYRPEDMPDCHICSLEHPRSPEGMYRKLMVPDAWLPELFRTAKMQGIGLFASVFSVRAVHELLKYDVPYIKIASPDSTRLAREVYVGIAKSVPPDVGIIVSDSGTAVMSSDYQLYCPRGHPPIITADDLRLFSQRNYYGFSDHTPGLRTPLAFIRAGAKMIEKHLKLDDDCVDAAFSADPQTMKLLCKLAKNA